MSRIESAARIEGIVGAKRHPTDHLARAVSTEERVYILHSVECIARGIDLRECEYSVALDQGIDLGLWEDYQDRPVKLVIDVGYEDLTPVAIIPESADTGRAE